MRDTNAVAALTEGRVLAALVTTGLTVAIPFGVARYDLVVDLGEAGLKRVQCKTGRLRRGAIVYNVTSVHRRDGAWARRAYQGEADYFGIYCPDTDKVYLVPVGSSAGRGSLRVEATLNGRKAGICWAEEYQVKPDSIPVAMQQELDFT